MSVSAAETERLDWQTFLNRFRWKQGEHLTLLGPTGQGKTTLALQLLPKRDYVVVFATKRRDPLIAGLKKKGYVVQNEFTGNHEIAPRVVLQAKTGKSMLETKRIQRKVFGDAIEHAYHSGGWSIYMDEAKYVCDTLGLTPEAEMVWHQGRTLGVSMVAGTQRPVKIPVIAYDGATHLFFWRENDDANLRRLGGMGGVDGKLIRATLAQLEPHEVLYLNTRSGEMVRTKAKV